MLTKERKTADHTDRVTLTRTESGWEIREDRDGHVVSRMTYQDWHRVERALKRFDLGFAERRTA
jgi:hypothetical protein